MNSKKLYADLHHAFSFFNSRLFGGRLPDCAITLERRRGAKGVHYTSNWADQKSGELHDEISLNPETFWRGGEDVLSTLVHEMCHLEQRAFGSPSRGGYHNREWARMMHAVGLQPYNIKEPEKETGPSCSHTVKEDGAFAKAWADLEAAGWSLDVMGLKGLKKASTAGKNKVKYTCPECGTNAWGKPELRVICGDCDEELLP